MHPLLAQAKRTTQILTMDGAGIYGLSAGLWLQQMVDQDPEFLGPGQVDLFAGISSGAVNSLLLARRENPRDGIADIVRIWHAAEPWLPPEDPLDNLMSLYGLTAWYGGNRFMEFLDRTFGDTRLGDVPNRVLVCCFDLSDGSTGPPGNPVLQAIESISRLFKHDAGCNNGDPLRHWRPVLVSNFLDQDWMDFRLADLAYAATAMPTMRPVRKGLADAGIFNGNPSTMAIVAALDLEGKDIPDPFGQMSTRLSELSMLSIGDGSMQPFMSQDRLNWGWMPWMMMPANGVAGAFPPQSYSLQPGEQMNDLVARTLLGGHKYLRLNPPVLPIPCATTCYAARFDPMRALIVKQIEAGCGSPGSRLAVRRALDFVGSPVWKGKPYPPPTGGRPLPINPERG